MKYVVEDTSLVAVADAIRAKTGKSDPLTLAQMPTEIESIEGGGASGLSFPDVIPPAGVYKHGTNFTELLYSWDEIWANGENGEDYESEYNMWDNAGYITGTVGGDIILPDEPLIYPGTGDLYLGIELYCGNAVIPAWSADCSSGISLFDFKSMYGRPNSTRDCNLETIYIKATTPPPLYMPKEDVPHLTKIVVPKGCADAYKSATGWCDYAEIIVEAGGGGGAVGKSLAAKIIDQDQITEVTATDLQGLTKIPMETFSIMGIFSFQDSMGTYYYDTIEKITLPETVTEIASNGISYVSKLKSLTVLAETPPTLGGWINGNASGTVFTIYVPAASVDLYKAATNWRTYDIQAIA